MVLYPNCSTVEFSVLYVSMFNIRRHNGFEDQPSDVFGKRLDEVSWRVDFSKYSKELTLA